jgi:cation transport regulator ChaC
MRRIGILAFGSIITNPDTEIEDATEVKVSGITTDFEIEFARKSMSRNDAPTLAVVKHGGASVQGTLFILKENITMMDAKNILFRRETNKVGDTSVNYSTPREWMEIKQSQVKHPLCEIIIYASMTPNLPNPSSRELAVLAIRSAEKYPMKNNVRADGIQYLYEAKTMGIKTPLMDQYEAEILHLLNVKSLEAALTKTQKT